VAKKGYTETQAIADQPVNQPEPQNQAQQAAEQPYNGQGTPTVAQLRAMRAGQSEDFGRFSDAQVQAWLNESWDPQLQGFRSNKTDQQGNPIPGVVDKPDDVPDGWEAFGINGARRVGSGDSGQASTAQDTSAAVTGDQTGATSLQDSLTNLFSTRGSVFSGANSGVGVGGGGIWWSPQANSGAAAAPPTLTPASSSSPGGGLPATPAQQGLTSVLGQVGSGSSTQPGVTAGLTPDAAVPSLGTAVANMFQQKKAAGPWWRV